MIKMLFSVSYSLDFSQIKVFQKYYSNIIMPQCILIFQKDFLKLKCLECKVTKSNFCEQTIVIKLNSQKQYFQDTLFQQS